MKIIRLYLLLICLSWSLSGCGNIETENFTARDRIKSSPTTPTVNPVAFNNPAGKLAEVAPPVVIRELAKSSDRQPLLEFIAPQRDRVLPTTEVEVKLKVENLNLFRDKSLGLGPHVNLVLDDRSARQVYDLEEPIILTDLAPGTHTLRAFAVQPWQESYKNPEAFALTTFHVLTKTDNNNPDLDRPLLTYNSPEGTYGAEPILLDFYLSNAPLHIIARENPNDEIKDWRIRVTINGESFILEDWQPIYLTGFEKGNNWVQIELLDEEGNNLENAFNNTVRLVNYNSQTQNSLDKLVTGQISLATAQNILEPTPKVEIVPEIPETIESEVEAEERAIAPQETPSDAVESLEETPVVDTSEPTTEIIEIEPEASDVEIIEIEENLETEKLPTKIEPSPTVSTEPDENELKTKVTEIEPNITSIEIIEADENTETEQPIAEIKLPDASSVEIIETNEAIASTESELETPSEPKLKTPQWLRNLWRDLLGKIQSLARRLPNRNGTAENI